MSGSPGRRPEIELDAVERAALRKAAVWAAIAGVAHIVAPEFAPGFYPSWYFALGAVGYGLLLPVIASLHARHELFRRSGTILGTIAGASVVTLGIGASASVDLIPAALFVRGVWWWTIGKLWTETGTLPRVYGWITMVLAIACFVLVGAYAFTGIPMSPPDLPLRMILGGWLIVLAAFFWRDAR